jgi:hypothetical protein
MPDNGPGPNIYATLGLVDWHVYDSTSLASIGPAGQDYIPFPPNGEDPPIYVKAPGEADCDWVITTANSMPWWFHTLHNDE